MHIPKINIFCVIIGETLNEEQVDTLFAECMGEENDDGEIEYIRKCDKIIELHSRGGGAVII